MRDLLVLPAFLAAALCLWWVVRGGDAFERLHEADRTQGYRLAMYCGVNPHALPELVVRCEPAPLYRWAR